MSRVDLECGCRSTSGAAAAAASDEEEEDSVCFSDADDEEGSCNSNFYSTGDGDGDGPYDDYNSEILEESVRASSAAADPSDTVDLERGDDKNPNLGTLDRDCRICHLSLVSSSPGSGIAIELGCSCKDDLAAAHKHCADTWFKIKGNKTCEICNSIARNVVGPNDIEAGQAGIDGGAAAATASAAAAPSGGAETRTCLNGHRFLNFLLACMVFAFVISWLFHFNIPS